MELSEETLRQVFDSVDVHGHGFLNINELKSVLNRVGASVTEQVGIFLPLHLHSCPYDQDLADIDPESSGQVLTCPR